MVFENSKLCFFVFWKGLKSIYERKQENTVYEGKQIKEWLNKKKNIK